MYARAISIIFIPRATYNKKKSYNVNFQRLISFEFSFFMDHFFVEYLLNVLNSA
jgi:hypothetical protein